MTENSSCLVIVTQSNTIEQLGRYMILVCSVVRKRVRQIQTVRLTSSFCSDYVLNKCASLLDLNHKQNDQYAVRRMFYVTQQLKCFTSYIKLNWLVSMQIYI